MSKWPPANSRHEYGARYRADAEAGGRAGVIHPKGIMLPL